MISISWWVSSGGKSSTQWIPTSSTDNLDSTISSMMTSLLIFSVAVLYAFPDCLIVSSVVYSFRTISFAFFKPNLSLPVALRYLLKDNGYSIMLQFTKQYILQSIKHTKDKCKCGPLHLWEKICIQAKTSNLLKDIDF